MKLIFQKALLIVATLMLLGTPVAGANETAEPASGTAPGVVVKVGKAIERGAKAAVSGVERGAKAAATSAQLHGKEGHPLPATNKALAVFYRLRVTPHHLGEG